MNKRQISSGTTVAVGLILMVVSALVFFLMTEDRTAVHWWGIAFILAAELLATVGIVSVGLMSQGPGTYRPALLSGAYSALIIYAAAAIVCSVVFMRLMPRSVRTLISLQLIFLAAAAIFMVMLVNATRKLAAGVDATMYAVATLDALTQRAEGLARQHGGTPLGAELDKLYEALRFSDHATVTMSDQALFARFEELEGMLRDNAEPETVSGKIVEMNALVQQRAAEVRQTKLGSI